MISDNGHTLQLPDAIERFESYLREKKMDELRVAFDRKKISASTLRNWANDRKKLRTSYRRFEFVEAMGLLPDLDWKKRNDAYEFGLKELGVGIDSQRELESYDGTYRFVHDFHDLRLYNFVIKVERSPFVAMFVFKYTNRDGNRKKCDGLIVCRHGRLVCAGFSPSTMFQAVFRMGGDPTKDTLRGMAFIEDVASEQICFSNVAMVRIEHSLAHPREIDHLREIEKTVRSTGRNL